VKVFLSILGRYFLVWIVNVLALLLATSLMPGFRFDTTDPTWWTVALTLPIKFAILIILMRPLMLLATLPLNGLTLGLPTLLFNGLILYVTATIEPSFIITNFGEALLGAVLLTAIATSIVGLLGIDEAYPFFQSLIYRIGRRFGPARREEATRGVLLLQIDGLSHTSLERTLERGRMPTVSAMLARGTHRLLRWNCGIPSNTPAVQAGFLYGTREDVAGYRWYDRQEKRVRVVSKPEDLRQLEQRIAARGTPLLAGGSCINTFMSGGAAKRLMTVSVVAETADLRRDGEQADFNLFFLSPFAYTRAVLATLWDYLAGLILSIVGLLVSDRPRLKFDVRRLAQKAVANAFLRETAFFWLKQDIIRGVPVIYSNFVGYDDVAHYSGPDTYEAQISLAAFDRMLRKLRRAVRRRRQPYYEILLLSDHGQTPSVPFRALYGHAVEDLLEELAGRAVTASEQQYPDTSYVAALLSELRESRPPRRAWVAERSRRTLERISVRKSPLPAASPDEPRLVVCVSGCLAHVYFTGHERQLHLEEIRDDFPGLVESLARHPGIGFVAVSRACGDAVAICEDGLRNLITDELVGKRDPLAPWSDRKRWANELAQLIGYRSSGDLIINGAWLPEEERIVVLEEQTSSHGGLGGLQTEPFIVVPSGWEVTKADLEAPETLHDLVIRNLPVRPEPVQD